MDSYLKELLERMNDTSDQDMEAGYDSSTTISWKALREAETLDNKEFIPQLITYIDAEKNKKKRDRAYFILGHLAKNSNDITAVNYLIQRIDKETDKYIISALLNRISDIKKTAAIDLQPIITATKNEKWMIRHSAIRALNYSEDEIAEATLLKILDHSDDFYELIYANSVLNKIGTEKAIPYLEKHLKSRKRDVKGSAQFAIEQINERQKRQ